MPNSAAPTFEFQVGKETRTFEYGFLAFEELGCNPLEPGGLRKYMQGVDIGSAMEWVRAGLLWEYEEGEPRHGQDPPTKRQLMRHFNIQRFYEFFPLSLEAAGLVVKKTEETAEEPKGDGEAALDPPAAA